MGSVPLLNRDGEIGIARRIERGQTKTRRILSRCPVIIQEMVQAGRRSCAAASWRRATFCSSTIRFRPTKLTRRARGPCSRRATRLAKLRKKFLQLKQKMVAVPRQTKPKQNRRTALGTGAAGGADFAACLRDSAAASRGEGSDLQAARGGGRGAADRAADRAQSAGD